MPIDFPNSPTNGDTYSAGGKNWQYNGTSWVLQGVVPTIPTGSITESQLAANSVTTAKIAAGAVVEADIANDAVTSGKIASSAVTAGKIASNAVTHDKLHSTLSAITICTSSTKPASPFDGQVIYMTDVDQTAVWDGSQWTVLAPIAGGRNAVINGGMDVWQRGTTSTSTADGYLVADRWYAYKSAGNTTLSRQTASLDNFTYSLRFQRVSGATEVGVRALAYMLENTTTARLVNKTIILSFWAKSGANYSAASSSLSWTLVTGTGSTDVNFLSTGYTGQANTGSGSVTLTTSWQRFSVSISVPSGKTQMGFYFSYTPVGTAGANDWFEITGVQLEAGAVATPFEFEDYGTTLAKCQRYYYKSYSDGTNPGSAVSATYAGLIPTSIVDNAVSTYVPGYFSYPVAMRTAPTLTYYDAVGNPSKFSTLTGGGLARTDNVGAVYSLYTSTSSGFYIALPGASTWANIMIVAAAEL